MADKAEMYDALALYSTICAYVAIFERREGTKAGWVRSRTDPAGRIRDRAKTRESRRNSRVFMVASLHQIALAFSRADGAGRRGVVDRAEYLIDRFRVRYEYGGGWKCVCAEFAGADTCKHTREAAGRRAAQAKILEHIKRSSPEAFDPHGSRS
jgi:hypothetical protein